MITIGNFIFRWRDTIFSLIILGAFVSLAYPHAYWGGRSEDLLLSGGAIVLAVLGIVVRALATGFAFVQRAGLEKRIHAQALVTQGVYAHCRNPLYIGNILIVLAAALAVNAVWFYAAAVPFFFFMYACIILAEEKYLSDHFGDAYREYAARVNRFWPQELSKWSESRKGMEFSFRRVLKKEHGTITLTLLGVVGFTIAKLHFRHGSSLDSPELLPWWAAVGALVIFQVTSAVLKRMGKLEWS